MGALSGRGIAQRQGVQKAVAALDYAPQHHGQLCPTSVREETLEGGKQRDREKRERQREEKLKVGEGRARSTLVAQEGEAGRQAGRQAIKGTKYLKHVVLAPLW